MTRKEQAEEEAMKWLATKYGTIRPDDAFVAGWLAADQIPKERTDLDVVYEIKTLREENVNLKSRLETLNDCLDEKSLKRLDKFFRESGITPIPPGRNLERNNK